jgi:cell division protein FtsB
MKKKDGRGRSGKLKMSILIPLIFIGYCCYTLFEQQMQINKYDSQIKLYGTEIEEKNELIDYYNNQKDNVDSDEYIEKVARESLGLVKPYEKIFIDANK